MSGVLISWILILLLLAGAGELAVRWFTGAGAASAPVELDERGFRIDPDIQDPIGARKELIKLWAEEPHRDLPFRFGYPDKDKHNHLMVMQPKTRARS